MLDSTHILIQHIPCRKQFAFQDFQFFLTVVGQAITKHSHTLVHRIGVAGIGIRQ